jgi:NAD(P)-dependent dehydrogenase (short-subunit alcohol dehydrogenase family)
MIDRCSNYRSSGIAHARVAGWRHACVTGECDTEGASRAVTYPFRHLIHTEFALAEQPFRHRHAPDQKVLHRCQSYRATEPGEESRAGQGRFACELRHRPGMFGPGVQSAQCGCQTLVGKPPGQTRSGGGFGAAPQGLDQQHFQQPFEHQFARRPLRTGLVTDQMHQRDEPRLATCEHQLRQQGNQQGRVRRTEVAVADAHAQVGRSILAADAKAAVIDLSRDGNGSARGWVDALVHQIMHGGNEHEVPGLQQHGWLTIHRHTALPFQDRAEERLSHVLPMDPPKAGALHQLGEASGGLKKSDNLGKRIDGHERTYAKENDTHTYIKSCLWRLPPIHSVLVETPMSRILITGCSSGFGLETAKFFLDRDWEVVATMRTPRADLLPPSKRLLVLPLDVTEPASIARAVAAAGPIDALVNNAGLGAPAPIELTAAETAHALFQTNTIGTLAMTQAVLPQFRERRTGVIINVTSSVTLKPLPLIGVYRASKAAVNAFTESLAAEVNSFGVRVHLVLPGRSPETRFGENARPHLRGLDDPDYAPLIQRFMTTIRESSGPMTHASDVAEAIWRAVTDPSAPLKIAAGADAEAWMAEARDNGNGASVELP